MEPFTKGWHIYDVPVYTGDSDTLYTKHADAGAKVVVYLVAALLLIGAVMQFVNRKRER